MRRLASMIPKSTAAPKSNQSKLTVIQSVKEEKTDEDVGDEDLEKRYDWDGAQDYDDKLQRSLKMNITFS